MKWKKKGKKKMVTDAEKKLFKSMQKDPFIFIKKMWGLIPQPILPEYEEFVKIAPLKEIKAHMFAKFEKGKHLTWQQYLFIRAVRKAIQNKGSRKISVVSGHGTGKSTSLAWLIIWFLWCFKNAQVPTTAPTSDQLHDILWKELYAWLQLMPEECRNKFDWSAGYLRVTESPATWFARAKTARKENPEALAGVHADWVMMVVDEASGVPREIFDTAKGALTNENILFIMISNGTRLMGYFYDSHHKLRLHWQNLSFNSEESPIVDPEFVATVIRESGEDSDEYIIRVKGGFPREDAVDDKGYVPLLKETDLKFARDSRMGGRKKMGVDPSGEGNDTTTLVLRDYFKAKIATESKTSDEKSIAQDILTFQTEEELDWRDITVDNFGIGANVSQEVALAEAGARVRAVNVGDTNVANKKRFLNKRAECYWRLREWLRAGGELVGTKTDWEELLTIRYRRELSGKIKIMSKKEMRDEGYKSPNRADALSLTFFDKDPGKEKKRQEEREEAGEDEEDRQKRKSQKHKRSGTVAYPGGHD